MTNANKALTDAISSSAWHSDKAAAKKQVDEVRAALAAGADPNARIEPEDEDEARQWINPLHRCAKRGAPEVVVLLLEHGADPNLETWFQWDWSEDKNHSTALHLAVERGNAPITRALLIAGAKTDAKDYKGRTPFDFAKKSDLKKLLELAAAGALGATTKVAPAKRSDVPKRLVDFFVKDAAKYQGRELFGLIAFDGATTVKFLAKPGVGVFNDRDVDPLTCPDYHVLASLVGEEHFLVVDGSKPQLPVLRWESETAKFEPVDDSLDGFLARLTVKAKTATKKAAPTKKAPSKAAVKSPAKKLKRK